MIEKWKKPLDKGNFVEAINMDLSKALHTPNNYLLITKREAHGFSITSLRYIPSHLNQRLQRTRVTNRFSLWKGTIAGVS